MRANRQLHDEVTKHFYKNWRLFVRVDASYRSPLYLGEVCYERARPIINSAILELVKELEIRVYEHLVYSTAPPSSRIRKIFDTFKIERVRITFELSKTFEGRTKDMNLQRFGKKIFTQIPASVSVSWSRDDAAVFFRSTAIEHILQRALQERVSPRTDQNSTLPERVLTQ